VNSQPKLAEKAPPRPPAPREAEAEEPPNNDGDHREARDLFRRAKKAFEKKDYWGTIVHCRYAIQFADDQAEYFHLLGLALAQNRQWRQEAEENLKIATDLDPSKPEYFGALGELYRDEGLDRMFEKAKGIDPNYQIPDER
jgi:tetratricopeptide (TPR) repeat protein